VISTPVGDRAWTVASLTTILPLTAILHHAVSYPYTCILQPLTTTDYSGAVIGRWLRSDPAPAIALMMAIGILVVGWLTERIRLPVVAFLIATAPLTLWLWDIPLTGRVICRLLHDGRAGLHTRHLYLAAAAAWWPTLAVLQRVRSRTPAAAAWPNPETAVR
jgi:hypothetical protein